MPSEQWNAQNYPQQVHLERVVLKMACSWRPQANGETMNRTSGAEDVSTLAADGRKH